MTATTSVAVAGRAGLPAREVRRIVTGVLGRERRTAQVSIAFLGLTAMRRMNARFKGRDAPTDVLAFALPLPGGGLAGDIYLCPGMAAREARQRGISRHEELVRLVVHGTLHVLGYDHPEGVDREAAPMWRLQESLVGVLL